jgi:hypothetical protein
MEVLSSEKKKQKIRTSIEIGRPGEEPFDRGGDSGVKRYAARKV